jgi:hypothetical protein
MRLGGIQLNPHNEPWMLLNATEIALYVEYSTKVRETSCQEGSWPRGWAYGSMVYLYSHKQAFMGQLALVGVT